MDVTRQDEINALRNGARAFRDLLLRVVPEGDAQDSARELLRSAYLTAKAGVNAFYDDIDALDLEMGTCRCEPGECDHDEPAPAVDLSEFRGRLDVDPDVSPTSPVVKGTWVTVAHVVSLIVEGWVWNDILRAHPELDSDDIRACLAFTASETKAA